MLENNNKQVVDIQISPEENSIIEYINVLQTEMEAENSVKILELVTQKFGDLGKKVLEQLNEDIGFPEEIDDCPECGKVSEEWLKESQEKLKNIEIFLNNDYDEIIEELKELNGSELEAYDAYLKGVEKISLGLL